MKLKKIENDCLRIGMFLLLWGVSMYVEGGLGFDKERTLVWFVFGAVDFAVYFIVIVILAAQDLRDRRKK